MRLPLVMRLVDLPLEVNVPKMCGVPIRRGQAHAMGLPRGEANLIIAMTAIVRGA